MIFLKLNPIQKQSSKKSKFLNIPVEINLKSKIGANKWGGLGILHTGTIGSNAIQLKHLEVNWN